MQIRNRVLLLLSFAFDGDSIRRVREALVAGSATQVSYALEIMDVQLPADWKNMVMPLLEDLSPQARSRRFATFFRAKETKARQSVCMRSLKMKTCPIGFAPAQCIRRARKGDDAMLSTVEKVLILKSVPMFSQTPDNVLADVADLLEEVDVSENETIFKQGDSGDSLYVILDGKVRVHDGERLLNYLGERDVFGEMALLDPEPRSATVTAVEATRLFRLDQSPFYELMEERPEIAAGIIRVLTGRLRNRVSDIAQLNARIKELESAETCLMDHPSPERYLSASVREHIEQAYYAACQRAGQTRKPDPQSIISGKCRGASRLLFRSWRGACARCRQTDPAGIADH